jgi:hypothetical protein
MAETFSGFRSRVRPVPIPDSITRHAFPADE